MKLVVGQCINLPSLSLTTSIQARPFLKSRRNNTAKKIQKLLTEIEGKIYSTTEVEMENFSVSNRFFIEESN